MPRLQILVHGTQKKGNKPEEYEDASAYDSGEPVTLVAVSDGATDAFESRYWSRALVDQFVKQPPEPDPQVLLEWLEAPIEGWRGYIQWEQLAWYAEEKARRGSFATLLGMNFQWVQVVPGEDDASVVHWRALSVGDVCLFQFREDTLVTAFPVQHSEEFGTTPALLSTRLDYSRKTVEELKVGEGDARIGDVLLVMTDALAAWFMRDVEAGQKPWQTLLALTSESFVEFVEHLRQGGEMRNDDVTLLIARVEGGTEDGSDDAVGLTERLQHGDPEPTEQL